MKHWKVTENQFDSDMLGHHEAVFTIGNGYLGTRGTFEEGYPGSEPVTLVHGIYDDVPIVHTELVNAPSWIELQVLVGGERFRMDRGEVLAYIRELDLQAGVLRRSVRWRSPSGHTVDLAFERFASLADPHSLDVRCCVTSIDATVVVEIRAGISGIVDNAGVRHLRLLDQGPIDERSVYLEVQTAATGHRLGLAAALEISAPEAVYTVQDCPWSPTVIARGQLAPGQCLIADKLVAIYTSRDSEAPRDAAIARLARAQASGFDALLAAHREAWAALWQRADIVIDGDDAADLAVRYSLFQLMIAAPRFDDRVSIPAKTLSGYGYRGHVFWDTEIFMLPFFIYTQPEVARNMLMYRYQTLPGARQKAAGQGFEGAMYAWESAGDGTETTPRWVPVWVKERGEDELVRIWCGDIELHITADVAYAVQNYWRVTGDDTFLRDYGAEILLETARFWVSRAEWHPERGIYEIRDVIGPDENHDHISNNAFTNGMAQWNIKAGLEVVEWLRAHDAAYADALLERLGLTDAALCRWTDVMERLYLEVAPDTCLIEQFEGFYDLEVVDFQAYEPRTISFQALFGIEETQRRQVLKQPDVLMLLYLLDGAFSDAVLRANWAYYTPKTDLSFGSSLGPAIQAALAARLGDSAQAYHYFRLAAQTDLENTRSNAAEGIHGATAGGLWQAVIFGFGGIRLTEEGPVAAPRLPVGWQRLAFNLCYRGQWLRFDLRADS